MRDLVSTERISAYLDGELSDDEQQLVERMLAESEEHRQLLKELEAVRADLRALPTFAAPPDLQARIAAQIEASKVSPVNDRAATLPTRKWSQSGILLATVAAVAAMLAIVLISQGPTVDPPGPDYVDPPIRQTQDAPAHLQKPPQMTMVYDITVTEAGHQGKALGKLLEQLEIGLDPTMKMPADVEDDLMAFRGPNQAGRVEPFKKGEAALQNVPQKDVEMIYISGTLFKIDQLGRQLFRMRNAGEDVANFRMDLVFEDRQLEVMRKLHESALDHFVHNVTAGPAEEAYAFRLNFQFQFASFGVPGAGGFALPALSATVTQAEGLTSDASSPARDDAEGSKDTANGQSDRLRPEPTAEDQAKHQAAGVDLTTTGQVLVILRRPPAEAE